MRKHSAKNNLDEMQEQTLLKIESRGVWLAFYGLALSIVMQILIGGKQMGFAILGESILLLILSLYMVIACLRHGIWDRRLHPTPKTNTVISVFAGIFVGIAFGVRSYVDYHAAVGSICVFLFCAAFSFALCFAALTACSKIYEKKQAQLETEEKDSE